MLVVSTSRTVEHRGVVEDKISHSGESQTLAKQVDGGTWLADIMKERSRREAQSCGYKGFQLSYSDQDMTSEVSELQRTHHC